MKYIKTGILLLVAVLFVTACKNTVAEFSPSGTAQTQTTGIVSPAGNADSTQPAAAQAITRVTLDKAEGGYARALSSFDKCRLKIEPESALDKIKSVESNGKALTSVSASGAVFGNKYHISGKEKRLYIDPQSLKEGLLLVFKDDSDAVLGSFRYDGKEFKQTSSALPKLSVKLTGTFEAAVVGQDKYDAVSGASGSISTIKNSDVKVWVSEKENPQWVTEEGEKQTDWIPVNQFGASLKKSKIKIYRQPVNPQDEEEEVDMGMQGVFWRSSSSIVLKGKPAKAGRFKIKVELCDDAGRKAVSEPLPFNVYDTQKTTLSEVLKTASNEAWDMEPWTLSKFGTADESVTVPATLKRWFGSHVSGTYGELGYSAGNTEDTKQTLVVGANTNLKLINMKILSSVNIVVKDGGSLNLQDSSVHGTVTVEKGGVFQMNYDNHEQKYATGASINGRLILKDGAVLKDSLIYSNTNFLSNGNKARRNDRSVVIAEGNVTVKGKVYIRGDESATGDSEWTGKPCTGQPALCVKDGTLTIENDAELGLYGGGRIVTTFTGGEALILENGTVTGQGKLIAVGGSSQRQDGPAAVLGLGTGNKITVKEAFLQGGNTYSGTNGGAAYTGVEIDGTIGAAYAGKKVGIQKTIQEDQPAYWDDILLPPPTDKCQTTGMPPIRKTE